MLKHILDYNKEFVEGKLYEEYHTDKYPSKKIAILSCMDTRLTHLLPAALGLKNGDAKIIKNAGAQILHPYGSIMKSLLVAVYELGVEHIIVIGHDDCGIQELDGNVMISHMLKRGIPQAEIDRINQEECNLEHWLSGFHNIDHSVCSTVRHIKECTLLPPEINVYGLIMNPITGEVREADHLKE